MNNRLARWRVVLLVVVLLFAAGCAVQTPPPQGVQERGRDPSHAHSTSENGIAFEWRGVTEGYQPAQSETLDLVFENGSDNLWQGGYCIQLLSSDDLIAGLAQERFTLEPGASMRNPQVINLPNDLSPGAYALALVVVEPQGNAVTTTTIHVGDTDEPFRSPQSAYDAALAGCPVVQEPEGEAGRLVELAKADLAGRRDIDPDAIAVQSVEAVRFPDASLGVPEEGEMYAQVVTPGYIITLMAEGETHRYHGANQRVVFVPEERLPIPLVPEEAPPPEKAIEIPDEEAAVTLPLHILAHVGQPGEQVAVSLRWQDGTELTDAFTTLDGPDGRGLLIDSLDWKTESRPPQPESQRATLTIRDESGKILAQQPQLVLDPDDPNTQLIDLYWVLGETLQTEQRRVLKTGSIEATAMRELLWGPPPRNLAGFRTTIPMPEEVLTYPGREPDWGVRVELLGLSIEDGVATVNFSQEMQAYGGGSARVQSIRRQITRTLMQSPSVYEVHIAVAGQTEGVLQP